MRQSCKAYIEKVKGSSQESIAEAIEANESAVSRELNRNGGCNGSYNFIQAHGKAKGHRHRNPGKRTS